MTRETEIFQQIEKVKKDLRQAPGTPHLLHDLGVGYFLLGKFANAIIQLKKAVTLKPDNATYHFNLGNAYAENEQPHLAIQSYLNALHNDPTHVPSLNNLADCYERTGEDNKALELFHYLTRLEPEQPLSHFNLGNFFLRKNQHIKAVKCYERSLETDEYFVDAIFNISWVLTQARAYKQAIHYAEKGLAIEPGHAQLKELLFRIKKEI